MKSLADIVAETLIGSPVNESSDKKLLGIFEPLMTQFKVNGVDDQKTIKGRDIKFFIEDLAKQLKSAGLKSTAMADAEVIISDHSLKDKMVQIALYSPIETTYYAHYNDTGRNAICGVNPFGPDNGGKNVVRFDLSVDVAKAILRANGCKY